jgi:hypothetical protein
VLALRLQTSLQRQPQQVLELRQAFPLLAPEQESRQLQVLRLLALELHQEALLWVWELIQIQRRVPELWVVVLVLGLE